MNYLSIDLWTKRCWLAYTLEWIIFTLPWVARFELVKNLKKIVAEKKIDVIVVWEPKDLYWKDTRQLDRTNSFIVKLKEYFPEQKIESVDERFTTFEALNILWSQKLSKKDIAEKKDSMAAFLILETYMDKISKWKY